MVWSHSVDAFNTAADSTNRMHDDDVARTFGFRGGLVPGVDVWAYLTQPCVDRWGEAFLTGSTMEARFVSPVYEGEMVEARLDDDGSLRATGPDGVVRATGRAVLGELSEVVDLDHVVQPDPVPSASSISLASGTSLGTLRFTYRRELGAQYLRDVRDTHRVYADGAVCHPGFLARQANAVLHRNVVLGPWIHVGTRAHHRGLVREGDAVDVRARVATEYERKGHRFVDLDVEVAANGVAVWSAFHTAIWQPRGS